MPTRKPPPGRSTKHSASKTLGEPPRRGHMPFHEATDRTRANVALMVAAGIAQEEIADCLGISGKTLRRHYGSELATSYAKIKADIAGKLIERARGRAANPLAGQAEILPDLKAMKFYLETHGWVRSERVLVKDDGITDEADLSNLTDAEIEQRLAKLRRSAAVVRSKRKT